MPDAKGVKKGSRAAAIDMTKHLRFIRSQIRIFCRIRYKKIAAVWQPERTSEPKNILGMRRREIEDLGQKWHAPHDHLPDCA
jgi:hypothetical protein